MRYALPILLEILFLAMGIPEGFSQLPYWERALTYHFLHGNIFHLLANAICIYSVFDPRRKNVRNLPVAFAIATLVYGLTWKPIIGFSNILYAIIGLNTPSLRSEWWKSENVTTFLVVTVLMVAIPRFSAVTHIECFVLGVIIAAIRRKRI